MNKKTVCFLLVLLTISLISLGVRMSWSVGISSSSAKPKPRPRAVIENQIKTCKQIIKNLPTTGAVINSTPAMAMAAVLLQRLPQDVIVSAASASTPKTSRAPPVTA